MTEQETRLPFDAEPEKPARMVDTSLEAWERILPTLQAREVAVALAVDDYLRNAGGMRTDVTGGELTEWMKAKKQVRDVNGVRPRLTGLRDKGWLIMGEKRRCRAYGTTSRPYRLAVPAAAIARLKQVQSRRSE